MHRIGLISEYSRMQVPSLSRGCEIARFLFATWDIEAYAPQTKILEGGTRDALFSMVSGPNRVLTTLKSASNIRISSLVHPSKSFVWEGLSSSPEHPLPKKGRSVV